MTLVPTFFSTHYPLSTIHYPPFPPTSQYAPASQVRQLAYFGLFSFNNSNGLRFGRTGRWISFMWASFGVRPPFLTLQVKQAQTTFSQVVSPFRLRGTTWSMLNS